MVKDINNLYSSAVANKFHTQSNFKFATPKYLFKDENLLGLPDYKNKPIVLVESEKTAIICAINFPNYIWLSYGGINVMTTDKMKVLSGKNILIVSDLIENAIKIATKKVEELKKLNISAKIWDMRNGLSDGELNQKGFYNCDLEDFLIKIHTII